MNREKHIKLLSQLLKNSKQSDRDLGKILGVSQPTVTRLRKVLEKEAIRQYTVIPNLSYLGFEIVALTFISARESLQAFMNKAKEWAEKQSNVVFASTGQGIASTAFIVSVHRDYAGFTKFQCDFRRECGDYLQDSKTFMLSLKGDIILKHFSFNHISDASRNSL